MKRFVILVDKFFVFVCVCVWGDGDKHKGTATTTTTSFISSVELTVYQSIQSILPGFNSNSYLSIIGWINCKWYLFLSCTNWAISPLLDTSNWWNSAKCWNWQLIVKLYNKLSIKSSIFSDLSSFKYFSKSNFVNSFWWYK